MTPRPPHARAVDSSPATRRQWPRVACRRPVVLFPPDAGSPSRPGPRRRHVARLYDYSRHGIGMGCPVPLPVGGKFVVRVVGADARPTPIVFTVAYCVPEDGQYAIGARLTYVPGCERVPDAAAYAADSTRPDPSDPRLPPRRQESDVLPLVTSLQLRGKTVSNWDRVLDLRIEGERVWVCPHPPDREGSGWGVFVDRRALDDALDRLG